MILSRVRRRALPPGTVRPGIAAAVLFLWSGPGMASVNSYRFMHVTINTPWYIFLFLLMGIFAPFILMVVLMWRHSLHKRTGANPASGPGESGQ